MEELFLKLVNMSITASWLVLAVVLFRIFLKNAPKYIRVILWGLVGLRLVFPFSIESVLSLIPSSEPLPEEFLYAATPQINTGIPAVNNALNPVIAGSLTPVGLTSANPTQIWSFILSHFWLLGVALMLGYALISYLIIRKKVGPSIPVGKNTMLCDNIDTPFILGIFRPKIYFPSSIDQNTANHVLAHEKAHLKRKDHWWKPLGFLILTVYWFNPIMWLAYVLLCRDIEMACDEKVIRELGAEEKKAYSAALLNCSVPRHMIAACPLAFGEVGVKDRIKSVLNYKKPAFWIVVVAVIACVVVAVCFLTDPKDSGNDDLAIVENIVNENGYNILNHTKRDINISIPKSVLPDSIYSEEGHSFGDKEVVVYETGTTLFYLDSVRFANEGDDLLYFKFNTIYTPADSGTLTLLYSSLGGDESRYILWVENTTLTDDHTEYPSALSFRGVDGISGGYGGTSFTVYVDTEACKAAEGSLNFTVSNFTDVTYAKEGSGVTYEDLLQDTDRLAPGEYITTELIYWPLYSSYYWAEDPSYRYTVTEDRFYSEYEGKTFDVYWQWRRASDSIEDLKFFFDWYTVIDEMGIQELPSMEKSFQYQKIDTNHHLLLIDEEIYLVEGYDSGVDLTNVSAIYKLEPYDETDVPVAYPENATNGELSNLYSTISGQVYDSRYAQDMLIRNAILSNLSVHNSDDIFYAESHQIVSEMVACGAETGDGSPVGYRVVDVLAVVMKAERKDSGIVPSFAADYEFINATISIDEYADGTFKLSEYQENDTGDLTDYDLVPLYQHTYDQVVKYWGMDTGLMVDDLLDTISSSPAQYSNAQPYIEAHQWEYNQLVFWGEYTLNYCFNAFLNNQADGIRAEIMAAACRDIGETLGEDISFDGRYDNGPTWFEVFCNHAYVMYESYEMDKLAESNRSSWVLLKILEATPMPIALEQCTMKIVNSSHFTNGVWLLVDIKFPESVDLSAFKTTPWPFTANLSYTGDKGASSMYSSTSQPDSVDEASNTVRYQFLFDLDGDEPVGNDFTLTVGHFYTDGMMTAVTALGEEMTLSWQADVDDARIFTAQSGDSEVTLTISPYVVNVKFTNSGYANISGLYDSITIWDKDGRVLPIKGSYSGSQHTQSMSLDIILDEPVDIDNIQTVQVGGLTLK